MRQHSHAVMNALEQRFGHALPYLDAAVTSPPLSRHHITPPPVRPPRSQRERRVGADVAWRVILLERDHPEQGRALIALIRSLRVLTPAEVAVMHRLDMVVQGTP